MHGFKLTFTKLFSSVTFSSRWSKQDVTLPSVLAMTLLGGCTGEAFCDETRTCPRELTAGSGGEGGSPDSEAGASGSGGEGGGEPETGGSAGMGGASGMAGMAGMGGEAGAGGGGAVCDPAMTPEEDACVIDEAFGVFVSPVGDDLTGRGTRLAPYRSLGKGLEVAAEEAKRVYACADGEPYAESILIDAGLDGSEIYGGFRCASWLYDVTFRAKIASPLPVGLELQQLETGILIENLEIVATDATEAGASSFGLLAVASRGVLLRRVRVEAGAGADGAPGVNGQKGEDGAEPGEAQKGLPENPLPNSENPGGSWPAPSACGSLGGSGGIGRLNAEGGSGTAGSPDSNVTPAGQDNSGRGVAALGGSPEDGDGEDGKPGADGNAGAVGQQAAEQGTFSSVGFTPAMGNDGGANGHVAQGGGGGGAASSGFRDDLGASGGAGGVGGCGGKLGTGGGGGGASVAILAWESNVTLDASELVAQTGGSGGRGGHGGSGGAGGPGGSGGVGNYGIVAGDGGPGGHGGSGGPGSGGTGGPSLALVFHGMAPTLLNNTVLARSVGGMAGLGGSLQAPAQGKAPDGFSGAAIEIHEQP